jgi:adenylosuccinate lyase
MAQVLNRVKPSDIELKDKLVAVNRVTKVTKGGRNFTFSAIIVVGDENGIVGHGLGKAKEITEAITKGIEDAKKNLIKVPILKGTVPHSQKGKFGGAVGNLSAHYIAYPDHDWLNFVDMFLRKYDIEPEAYTTQVANNKCISEYFDRIRMINNILIDLCRDIWMYNSYGYFKQTVTADEVGSSTMPQKVNPIHFENAEGNLELANCLLSFMSDKLQISRMQRDLTDSTVMRNLGVALGHSVVAYKSLLAGLETLSINRTAVDRDLSNTGLLAEAYQIILKKD